MYEVLFTLSAESDLLHGFDWYEEKMPGLGWEFRNEIALCIAMIQDDRVSYRIYDKDIHRIRVARFPYIIYYRKDPNAKQIVIAAVLHERSDPNTARSRLIE